MTTGFRPNKVRVLNSLLLVLVILGAQFVVLTHTHDSSHHSADSLCKVCVSGEHSGNALIGSPPGQVQSITEFFLPRFVTQVYLRLFSTQALARAPPASL